MSSDIIAYSGPSLRSGVRAGIVHFINAKLVLIITLNGLPTFVPHQEQTMTINDLMTLNDPMTINDQ